MPHEPDELIEKAIAEVNSRFPEWEPTALQLGYARAVSKAMFSVCAEYFAGVDEGWIRVRIPDAETMAEIGEAADNALGSELGWGDIGRAAWSVISRDAEVTDWSGAVRGKFYSGDKQ